MLCRPAKSAKATQGGLVAGGGGSAATSTGSVRYGGEASPGASILVTWHAPLLDAVAELGAVAVEPESLTAPASPVGLGTSIAAIGTLGWRHIATVGATTLVILVVVTAGLALMR